MEPAPELRRLLHPGERIVWVGKPDGAVWGTSRIGVLLLIVVFLSIPVTTMAFTFASEPDPEDERSDELALVLTIAIAALVVVSLVALLLQIWWYKHIQYVFTPRRIILQRGLIGRDYEIVDFNRITDYSVRVGVWDRIWRRGTGSIRVHTASDGGATHYSGGAMHSRRALNHVPNAYDVQAQMLHLRDEAREAAEAPPRRAARSG